MKKLLVIDDDNTFTKIICESLNAEGFKVSSANSAAQGFNKSKNLQPEFILLDLKIATDSGLKMIPELLAENHNAKIVVLTGYANIQTAIEAIKLGAVHYLSKPATIAEIIAAFDKQIGDAAISIENEIMPLNRLEKNHIEAVVAKNSGNISRAARELKMHRRTLQRKLSKKA